MLLSIIITNYNYGKYLHRCVRSCLNQSISERDYEIIIVDDCSSDSSVKIAKEYTLIPNIKFIENKFNMGVAASANKGIQAAKGRFVVRVDADDFVTREFSNFLSYYMLEHPETLGVACDYYFVNEGGRKIKIMSCKEDPISCGIMYDRKKLLKMGLYNKRFKHREEEELRARLGNKYHIHHLNIALYRYRMHKSNKTKQKDYSTRYKDKLEKVNKIKDYKFFKQRKRKLIKHVVVIIPARGGSKRLKKKNIYPVWGKPMIDWPIKQAKKSNFVSDIYVTSDDKNILDIAKKNNVKIIKRTKSLSGDKTFKMEAIQHATRQISKKKKPTLVVSLQANSPDVAYQDIDKVISHLIKYDRNEVISVDKNYNQNGAIRAMKYNTVFQRALSVHSGFVVTNISDIHTKNDVKILEKKSN